MSETKPPEQPKRVRKNDEAWGLGNRRDNKPYAYSHLNLTGDSETPIELLHGEHPHSTKDENTYARTPDGEVFAFSGHAVLVDVIFESYNYLKESDWSGDEIRKGGCAVISFDRHPVYGFFYRDILDAMRRAAFFIPLLQEHATSYELRTNPQAIIGRRVYYRNTPAIVTDLDLEQGEICIQSDPPERMFPLMAHEVEEIATGDRKPEDIERHSAAWLDLLDEAIWWHRAAPASTPATTP